MIEFHDVTVCYEPDKRHPVRSLDGVSLKIERGDWVFLVGPSGAGKSSLLKLIYAGMKAQSGKISVDGVDISAISPRDVPALRRKIGIVFQDFQLLSEKTAWENVAFALRVIGTPQSVIVREVPRALETVGLTHRAEALPHELSGGEQQRVAIARAIVNNPPILLTDEPTGNLDPQTAREVGQLLTKINFERGTTIVMATHDGAFVDELARRVVRLQAGRVVSDENPGVYGHDNEEAAPDLAPVFLKPRVETPKIEAAAAATEAAPVVPVKKPAELPSVKTPPVAVALPVAAVLSAAKSPISAPTEREQTAISPLEEPPGVAETEKTEAEDFAIAPPIPPATPTISKPRPSELVAAQVEQEVETSKIETSKIEAPEIEAPKVEMAEVGAPKPTDFRSIETTKLETSEIETSEVEVPVPAPRVEPLPKPVEIAPKPPFPVEILEPNVVEPSRPVVSETSPPEPVAITPKIERIEPKIEAPKPEPKPEPVEIAPPQPVAPPRIAPSRAPVGGFDPYSVDGVQPKPAARPSEESLPAPRPMARRIAPPMPPPQNGHALETAPPADPSAPLGSPENPIVQYE